MPIPAMPTALETLTTALERVDRGLLLVLTGAGVSLASGIATFRGSDPGAVWKRDVTELGTVDFFRRDPAGSWRWYLERFDRVREARPNPAHFALSALERWQTARGGEFLLITQNIDTLHEQAGHEQAGSERLIKVHGSSDRVRCSRDGCRLGAPRGSIARTEVDLAAFRAAPSRETVPRCPACGSLLRQHVLWFDEMYGSHDDYQWERVLAASEQMALALCVGTSFSVGVTDLFLRAAHWNGVPLLSIDPAAGAPAACSITVLAEKAEELLPAACERLGAA